MQRHQHSTDQRRSALTSKVNNSTYDDFYTKLERIRLSTAASLSRQHPARTASELLDESKAFFVKSEKVLHNRQTFSSHQRIIPSFRSAQACRYPYNDQYQSDRSSFSSTSATSNISDSVFESVSVLSFSDQTTVDSANTPSHRKRTMVPSSVTIIERNARIIKWLFQLHKVNESMSLQFSS